MRASDDRVQDMTPNVLLYLFGGIGSAAVSVSFFAKWYWSDHRAYDLAWAFGFANSGIAVSLFGLSFEFHWPWASVLALMFYCAFLGATVYGNLKFSKKEVGLLPIALLMTVLAVVSIAIDLDRYGWGRSMLGGTAGMAYIWTGWTIRSLPVVGRAAGASFVIRGLCVIILTFLPPSIDRSWLNLFSNAMTLASGLLLLLGSLLLSKQIFQQADTRLREAHASLASSNQQLEAQTVALEAAAVRNREALRKAEAAIIAKRNFIANMHHELRTPLNAVIGFTELLKYETERAAMPALYEHAACAHAAGTAMLAKISRILDYIAIDKSSGGNQLMPFKPATALVEELSRLMDRSAEKQLTFARSLDDHITLPSDERGFRAIVRELLCNAITAAPQGTEIAIALHAPADAAILKISDAGPGLPDEFIRTVGESFNISEPVLTRGATQGVGLGLAITSRHAEAMGGALKLERNAPRGTIATVIFPGVVPAVI